MARKTAEKTATEAYSNKNSQVFNDHVHTEEGCATVATYLESSMSPQTV